MEDNTQQKIEAMTAALVESNNSLNILIQNMLIVIDRRINLCHSIIKNDWFSTLDKQHAKVDANILKMLKDNILNTRESLKRDNECFCTKELKICDKTCIF